MNIRTIGIAVIVVALVAAFTGIVSATPSGATTAVGVNETHTEDISGSEAAIGGYVTEVNLSVTQQTDKWQGYYGNVSGEIALRDAGTNVMINWTIGEDTGPLGEVYAIADSSLPTWTDFTADANLTVVNSAFGLGAAADVADGAEDTFTDDHTAFDLCGSPIIGTAGQCAMTWGDAVDQWETVILGNGVDANKDDYIFAGIIEIDQPSFKSQSGVTDPCDFQMIVPDSPTAGTQNTYYFYVEVT